MLSPGTRKIDETVKSRLYDRWSVQEYWVVDPEADAIAMHRRAVAAFACVAELGAHRGDALTSPLLPGSSAPLAELFGPPM